MSPEHNELIFKALRSELAPREKEAFDRLLLAELEFKQAWEEENALEQSLERLPDAPVSSNFTALVMQAVARDERAPAKTRVFPWWRFRFIRVATGLALVAGLGLGIRHFQNNAEQQTMAQSIGAFSEVAAVITPENARAVEVFQNFETIRNLEHLPAPSEIDMELLVALQR